ncbi:MAG: hypothetical protein LLF96_03840 [Eubacteriales bacterium]|nr:hypothetical protein [Eubacteriales bacterium]
MQSIFQRLLAMLLCVCFVFGVFPAFAAATPTPEPEPTEAVPYYRVGSEMIYITATGKRYHCIDDCGNTQIAFLVSLEEACRLGYTPCGRCHPTPAVPADANFTLPEGAVIVYLSVGDECYHRTAHCGSMENAVAVTLEEAVYLKKRPCEKCDPPQ